MPHKKSDVKGDLYLIVQVRFPTYDWLQRNQAIQRLKEMLPKPDNPVEAENVDDVEYEAAEIKNFGNEGESGGEWEDDEEDERGAQCQQQ